MSTSLLDYEPPEVFLYRVIGYQRPQPNIPLIITEGESDWNIWHKIEYFKDNIDVAPANGKANIIKVAEAMSSHKDKNIFLVADCDGLGIKGIQDSKGKKFENTVITDYRDLEADIFFCSSAPEKIYNQCYTSKNKNSISYEDMLSRILEVLYDFCSIIQSARNIGKIKTSVHDSTLNSKKRPIRPHDLGLMESWLDLEKVCPSIKEILDEISKVLSWSQSTSASVENNVKTIRSKLCRKHQIASCVNCRIKTVYGGHDLVSAFNLALSANFQKNLGCDSIDISLRALFLEEINQSSNNWNTLKRISDLLNLQ